MSTVQLDLEDELIAALRQFSQPLERSVRELVVLELYRQEKLSSGKAAELLGLPRLAFVHLAARLGQPYFSMSEQEWHAERRQSEAL